MAKKRISLAEIEKQDRTMDTPAPIARAKSPTKVPTIPSSTYSAASVGNEMVKVSFTIDVNIFEQLQDISKARRRAKQPFKMTEFVREAIAVWMPKQHKWTK